jgi:UDP-glucuronate 4-epimerase
MVSDLLSQLHTAVQSNDWPALSRAARRLENLALDEERQAFAEGPARPWWTGSAGERGQCYLVTGGAGFIGSHVVRRLLYAGHRVVAIDEFNDYYDPVLKWDNVADILQNPRFTLRQLDIRDLESLRTVFAAEQVDVVVHLAARAGVRPSIVDPQLYVTANVLGTQNLLELAREFGVSNFVYASSSSVYGGNTDFPFSESQNVDHPISPYAATKKSNEVQAACYSRLYHFPVSGLRFFTVYGPAGRPDMAVRMFIEKLDRDEPIPMYGDGGFERDFTYVDDIVNGILGVVAAAAGQKDWNEVFNLGESDTTTLRELILLIAKELGKIQVSGAVKSLPLGEQNRLIDELVGRGLIKRLPEQLGDVPKTYADVSKSRAQVGYDPQVKIAEGIARSVRWHREMKQLGRIAERERVRSALRVHCALRLRAGLDSAGRPKDPEYDSQDAQALSQALADVGAVLRKTPRDFLALRAQCELAATLCDVAAYLGATDDRAFSRVNGLSLWRKRREMIAIIRAGGRGGIRGADEARLLAIARSIVAVTGGPPVAVVVAAAGYGTRIADEVGGFEMKHRVFLGDEMILLSLRNVIPYSKRIVAVVSEKNKPDVQALIERSEMTADRGFRVDYVIQHERLGDGDAHLTAHEVLADFPGIIVFIFADAPTKSPETIEKMILIKQALGPDVPLVVPCFQQEKPYSPIVLSERGVDRGRVIWNWQKADEEDYPEAVEARQQTGLRNVGMFAAEPSVFSALQRFKNEQFTATGRYQRWQAQMAAWRAAGSNADACPKDPEFGFADLMKVLPAQGYEVAAACLAHARDRLNVNKVEDIADVNHLLKETCPCLQPMVETNLERGEVVVRFYDANADHEVLSLNGLPSIRNYTRFLADPGQPFNGADLMKVVETHIASLTRRIQSEVGLKVLPVMQGVVKASS